MEELLNGSMAAGSSDRKCAKSFRALIQKASLLIRSALKVLNYLYQRVFNGFDMHGVHYGNNQGYQSDNSYHNQPNLYCRQFPVKPWSPRTRHRSPGALRERRSRLHGGLLGLMGRLQGSGSGIFFRIWGWANRRSLRGLLRLSYGVAAIRAEIASLFNLGVAVRAYHFFTFSSCRLYGAVLAPQGFVYRYKFNLREWTTVDNGPSYAAFMQKRKPALNKSEVVEKEKPFPT